MHNSAKTPTYNVHMHQITALRQSEHDTASCGRCDFGLSESIVARTKSASRRSVGCTQGPIEWSIMGKIPTSLLRSSQCSQCTASMQGRALQSAQHAALRTAKHRTNSKKMRVRSRNPSCGAAAGSCLVVSDCFLVAPWVMQPMLQ